MSSCTIFPTHIFFGPMEDQKWSVYKYDILLCLCLHIGSHSVAKTHGYSQQGWLDLKQLSLKEEYWKRQSERWVGLGKEWKGVCNACSVH